MPPRGKLRRGLRPGSEITAPEQSKCCLMLHTGKQRCAAGGLLRDGSQRERQTESSSRRHAAGAGLRRRPLPEPSSRPAGRTSGFERSAVTGGKLVRHAAQQSVQQGNGGQKFSSSSPLSTARSPVLPRSGKRRAELRHIVRHGSLQRAEHGGVGGRAGGSRDQLGCLAEKNAPAGRSSARRTAARPSAASRRGRGAFPAPAR